MNVFNKIGIILLIVGLFFVSCNSNTKVDVVYKLIPVKTGNNWGYIDSTCSFKLDPVLKMQANFTITERLLLKLDMRLI